MTKKPEVAAVVPSDSSVAPKDTVVKKAMPKTLEPKKPVVEETPAKNNPPKKEKNYYMGLSLGYESFHEKYFSDYSISSESEDGNGFHAGFLVKWYIWNWMVFQTGLNGLYHFSDYDFDSNAIRGVYSGSVETKVFLWDVPLQLRIGVPLERKSVLFFSTSFHVRKPFYGSVYSEIDWNSYSGYDYGYSYWADGEFEDEDFYGAGDWEFLLYLGFGVEITRTFSIQWQFAPMYRATYTYISDNYSEGADVWRINMDIAW